MESTQQDYIRLADHFGLSGLVGSRAVASPIDGAILAGCEDADAAAVARADERAEAAFVRWRLVPAPRRGELVRRFAELLRAHKAELARLVTIDCGKPISEGEGEVQEMIDICDFALGLSRQLYGLTIASERPGHRMMESWHPLGVVAIISAFNFPVAVWAWNAALALVCGNTLIWKPSEKTPLSAYAAHALLERAIADFGSDAPEALSQLLTGSAETGAALVDHPGVALVSATGSTAMGRKVGEAAARRFARSLLELGGNNASIVCPSADLDQALHASAFGFMGTSGQRCTSLRRLFVHADIHDAFLARLTDAAARLPIGDPRDRANLAGPLIDRRAAEAMHAAIAAAKAAGGTVHGGDAIDGPGAGIYVRPAVVEMPDQTGPVFDETFAPLVYVMRYRDLDEAIARHNAVRHGLSSSIFTTDMREAERFLAANGSDCGIANVNIGTSGAEIGGAFGGEKETGGGRESGSDSWRAYMRRQTSTINATAALPLAQGVSFRI